MCYGLVVVLWVGSEGVLWVGSYGCGSVCYWWVVRGVLWVGNEGVLGCVVGG